MEQESIVLNKEEVAAVVADKPQEQVEQTLPSEEQTGELIAGKFKTQDDLLNAYKELEKKLGTGTKEVVDEAKGGDSESQDMSPEEQEYLAWKQEKQQKELLEPIGGLDKYKQAIDWARENMSAEEVNEYNSAIEKAGGDPALIKLLAKSLVQRYDMGNSKGNEPIDPIHSGGSVQVVKNKGYTTKSDMLKDMSDPRYGKDSSYRKQVEEKVARTDESLWYKDIPRY